MYVDSHCHLNYSVLSEDLQGVMERAKNNKLEAMLSISTKIESIEEIIAVANQANSYKDVPKVYCALALHPCHVEPAIDLPEMMETFKRYLDNPLMIGIGETGIDYYHSIEHKDLQKEFFRKHIELALEYDLPIIIHARDNQDKALHDAEADIFNIVKEYKGIRGVVHCFTGTKGFGEAMLDLGFFISFSGIVTFKNAKEIQEVAKMVPLEQMLIETDAPYLAPTPFRGKSNEPSYVIHTAEFLADLRGIPTTNLAKITTENFYRLFNRAKQII